MNYKEEYRKEIDDFLYVCKRLGNEGYVTSHGGNLAIKLEEKILLITPTRMRKADIKVEDLIIIDIDGNIIDGNKKPTGEISLYLKFFKERPDINSIIHCHPPYTNAFAVTKNDNILMRPIFPETCIEVGPVPVVPYNEPLTNALADEFEPFIKKYNAFIMESHGLIIISPEGIVRTMDLIEILESTSITLLAALSMGGVKELSKEDVENLNNTIIKRELPMIGAPGENNSLVDLYF
jgi:L-fuculose-phosphate aldolase